MGSLKAMPPGDGDGTAEHRDVVIVGAGLSGIGAAYRLQSECPGKSYAILEAREAIGGTWDLFRYPGVRSDSDMFTLGYPFRPWTGEKTIADGASIRGYIQQTAAEAKIDARIRFRSRIVRADWSSADAWWTLEVERTDANGAPGRGTLTCSFLYLCSGYYNYDSGYLPEFEGSDTFRGRIIHPQFWPDDLDYDGRNVVVIGSGATAVTLLPNMAERAAHVTMLQRSPSYVTAVPSRDKTVAAFRRYLPAPLAHSLARAKYVALTQGFYQLCRRRPEAAKRLIRKQQLGILGDQAQIDEHFTPRYQPWDQRLCIAPGADLFRTLKSGKASVVTDGIASFDADGIRLASGGHLAADVIVAATGLSMLPLGGVAFTVDGGPVDLGDAWVYRGVLVSGLPNVGICIGYTNASWTLRADLSSRYVCRLLRFMDRHGYASAVPRVRTVMGARPVLDLTSGYVRRSIGTFPKQGDRRPWTVRHNYLLDAPSMRWANVRRNMAFAKGPGASAPSGRIKEELRG
ncbi:MAG TPA: NAD(P)/FAD-dependent oxidoreductase [Micrococcaceae bacterium]